MLTAVNRHVLALVGCATLVGCDAELETSCITGDNCGAYEPVPGEQDLGDCLEGCAITQAGTETGDYPCEVQKIMDDICTNCHGDPPTSGAPFPLATYADGVALDGDLVVYAKIVTAVGLEDDPEDYMPLGGPPLDSAQRSALLDDWACVCAPPRDDGETCE
jgi:hypothetical protein